MKLISILLLAIFLNGCDFETPAKNDLVDLNQPILLHAVWNSQTTIEKLPLRDDITNQINWQYTGQEFEIRLQSTIDNTIFVDNVGDVYVGSHISYDVLLESNNFIELTNFDSVTSSIEVDIENLWPFPDEEGNFSENSYYIFQNPLAPTIVEMQYKTLDDPEFTTVANAEELLAIGLPFKLRLMLRISSGINLQTQTRYFLNGQFVTINDFVPNIATYRVKFFLNGIYL